MADAPNTTSAIVLAKRRIVTWAASAETLKAMIAEQEASLAKLDPALVASVDVIGYPLRSTP